MDKKYVEPEEINIEEVTSFGEYLDGFRMGGSPIVSFENRFSVNQRNGSKCSNYIIETQSLYTIANYDSDLFLDVLEKFDMLEYLITFTHISKKLHDRYNKPKTI